MRDTKHVSVNAAENGLYALVVKGAGLSGSCRARTNISIVAIQNMKGEKLTRSKDPADLTPISTSPWVLHQRARWRSVWSVGDGGLEDEETEDISHGAPWFDMSVLHLGWCQRGREMKGKRTHATSKPGMALFMPSGPDARVPNGRASLG